MSILIMRTIMLFFIIFFIQQFSYSQKNDSLVIGKKYRIILFDEKEIIGTHVSEDENTISMKADNILMTIEKNNIFSISKDISSSKYKFLINLFGEFVPKSQYGYSFGYTSRPVLGIDLRASYFYSEKKNVGIEFAYFPFSKSNSQSSGTTVFTGGETNSFDIILNGQFGTFDKSEIVDIYLNLGAGIHSVHRNSSATTYYDPYLLKYYSYSTPSETNTYPVLQLGAGIIIKPVKNIGINLEIDLNAYGFGIFIFPAAAYVPIKAGVSYYFMK